MGFLSPQAPQCNSVMVVVAYRSHMTTEIWVNIAWWHQAITWTNVDLSSVRSSDNHLKAIAPEMPQPSITKIALKIT